MKLVDKAGLVNYMFEVVTDKSIHLHTNQRVREVVVPSSYRYGRRGTVILYANVIGQRRWPCTRRGRCSIVWRMM